MAAGLGCLETLLRAFKLPPEVEANVRLQYATILNEETENSLEAEEVLDKGIRICERHRFQGLRYEMQHILTRIMFQKNARTTYKYLDNCIGEAQVYGHVAWIYAFRFLRASLHLETATRQDLTAALAQLRAISHLASEHGHKSILATATTMEALICLRVANGLEMFETVQRALATVRSLQLDPAIGDDPRLKILIAFVDISCHLQQVNINQAFQSYNNVQNLLDSANKSSEWEGNGTFIVPLSDANLPPITINEGVIRKRGDGSAVLLLNWMPKDDIYNVGYLLNGITLASKNAIDGHNSERMLLEGVKQQQGRSRPAAQSFFF